MVTYISFQFTDLKEISGQNGSYGGYQIFIHPPKVDIENALLWYPNFYVNPGDIRMVKLSKVKVNALSTKQNPCFDNDILLDATCRMAKVRIPSEIKH